MDTRLHTLRALMMLAMTLMVSRTWADTHTAEVKGLPVLEVFFNGKEMPKEYANGSMRLTYTDGAVVELGAKFKTRGATALAYTMKPSFNMKLRDADGEELDSTLCGLRSQSSWILDAMAIDRINMRNRVAFDTWNDFSRLPYDTNFDSRNGTIGQFVEVYINDEYKGIYCLTDRINRKLLNLKKTQVNDSDGAEDSPLGYTIRGVLYKHGTNDIEDQNKRCFSDDSCAYVIGYHDAWELTYPEDYAGAAAWTPLDIVYQYANDYSWIKEHFYLDQLAEYQIFIMALSIQDNWGNKNSFISSRNVTTDGNKHRFVYTPWDLDTSLGGSYNGSLYDGNYSDWKPSDVAKASTMPVPFHTCNGQAEFREMLRDAWIKGRDGALSVDSIRAKMYRYRDLFISTGAWERETSHWQSQKYEPPYVLDLAKEVGLIIDWYADRFGQMDAYFNIDPVAVRGVEMRTHDTDDTYYNLMGVRVKDATRPGIYIRGGKKVLITRQ